MPARKHRPIVMNRHKRPERGYAGLKKVFSVVAILAFIGIIVYAVFQFKNAVNPTASTGEKSKEVLKETPKEKIAEVRKDTAKPVAAQASKVSTKTKAELTLVKDTSRITKPALQKHKQAIEGKQVEDTSAQTLSQTEDSKTVEKVSDEQMAQILNDLNTERSQSTTAARCVTVRIVNNRNATNGSHIANYLRKNGFVISGREIIKGTLKGTRIDATGTCIKLMIGDL